MVPTWRRGSDQARGAEREGVRGVGKRGEGNERGGVLNASEQGGNRGGAEGGAGTNGR